MPDTSYDSKSNRTKIALSDSFKALMLKKPISKISIREITENCGYKRLTFYYHFEDIYDLLKWTIRRELVLPIQLNKSYERWEDVVLYVLRYLQSNETLALSMLDSIGRETLRKLISEDVYSFCDSILREIGSDLRVSDEDYHSLTNYYCVSLAALCADWLENGMYNTPENVTEILSTIIRGTARNALVRFSEKSSSQR